jgi:hypothetical protein
VIEGKLEGRIEMTGKRGRRRKQLLDDLKEKSRYWKLKEEALDRILWRTRFGRGYGPVVRKTRVYRLQNERIGSKEGVSKIG